MMAPDEVTGPQFRVHRSVEGYVRCDLADGAEVTGQDACAQLEAISSVTGGTPGPCLVDLRQARSVSREARTTFSNYEGTSRLALFVDSPLSRIIANFFIGVSGSPAPTKVFTDLDAAQRWLLDDE